MFQGELRFDLFNGLAGFNRGRTGQAANQEFAGLDAILEVEVGLGERFLRHANDYSKVEICFSRQLNEMYKSELDRTHIAAKLDRNLQLASTTMVSILPVADIQLIVSNYRVPREDTRLLTRND